MNWCKNCGEYTMEPEVEREQVVGEMCTACMEYAWAHTGEPSWEDMYEDEEDELPES